MYTNENVNIKSNIINNIMLQMSVYLDAVTLDILQKVVEEQFVFLNVERITTLPAKVDTSTEEKNNYLIDLYRLKKSRLAKETMDQYIGAIMRFITKVDKPLTDIDEIDIDYYLRYYENRNVKNNRGKNQASTCNNERRYLSAFFTWLRKEKFVTYNPVECVEPKRERRKPIDYFRPGQMEELREG